MKITSGGKELEIVRGTRIRVSTHLEGTVTGTGFETSIDAFGHPEVTKWWIRIDDKAVFQFDSTSDSDRTRTIEVISKPIPTDPGTVFEGELTGVDGYHYRGLIFVQSCEGSPVRKYATANGRVFRSDMLGLMTIKVL